MPPLVRLALLIAVLLTLPASSAVAATTSAGVDGRPSAAASQTRVIEMVDGRFFRYALHYKQYTVLEELKAWDFAPGSAISLVCKTPGCPIRSLCPETGCTDPTQTTGRAGATRGIVDLTKYVRGKKLIPGTIFEVRVTDPQGRTKRVEYTVKKTSIEATRYCAAPDRPGVFECSTSCEPYATDPSRRCEDLGKRLPVSLGTTRFLRSGSKWRVKKLEVRDVPADTFIEVYCLEISCPFHLKLVRTDTQTPLFDTARFFGRRKLPSGTQFAVHANQNDQVGKAWSFVFKGRKSPKPTERCIKPESLAPVPC